MEDVTGARHLREVNLAEGGSEGVGFVHAFTLLAQRVGANKKPAEGRALFGLVGA